MVDGELMQEIMKEVKVGEPQDATEKDFFLSKFFLLQNAWLEMMAFSARKAMRMAADLEETEAEYEERIEALVLYDKLKLEFEGSLLS